MDNCKYCDRYHNCSLMDEDFDPWIDSRFRRPIDINHKLKFIQSMKYYLHSIRKIVDIIILHSLIRI